MPHARSALADPSSQRSEDLLDHFKYGHGAFQDQKRNICKASSKSHRCQLTVAWEKDEAWTGLSGTDIRSISRVYKAFRCEQR